MADNRWYSNCIYNLMLQIERWSQGRVKAHLKPEALKLADREWIEKIKPPFVFITGHKSFKFTQAEKDNLREYLMLGGALWVDNSLPGRRSRFDVSLRRELTGRDAAGRSVPGADAVLPDREFETIPNDHPVYKSSSAHFDFRNGPPAGMNFYREPVECVKIGGEVAVFYTLNAYSDMWETGLTPKDEVDSAGEWSPSNRTWYYRDGPHWWYMYRTGQGQKWFRNLSREGIIPCYQFGINIVIHLLTRFQDKFMTLPRGNA